MTSFGGPRPVPRSAVVMATAASCVVFLAAVVGALSAPVVVGALGAVALGAVLSDRSQRPAEPRLLAPLPVGMATTRAHIIAPRAGELAAIGSAVHSDVQGDTPDLLAVSQLVERVRALADRPAPPPLPR